MLDFYRIDIVSITMFSVIEFYYIIIFSIRFYRKSGLRIRAFRINIAE